MVYFFLGRLFFIDHKLMDYKAFYRHASLLLVALLSKSAL